MVKVMGLNGPCGTQGPTQHNVRLLGVNSTVWERSWQKHVYQTVTFTEGKVYDVSDRGEEDIKAFLDNEGRARIQVA